MFTDAEIGMALAHSRDLRAVSNHAQRIIDRQASEIGLLMAALQSAREELKTEEAKRLHAEFTLETVLNTEIGSLHPE